MTNQIKSIILFSGGVVMEKTQVLLRMPLNLKNNIREIAKLQGLTTNALIITILNNYIKSTKA